MKTVNICLNGEQHKVRKFNKGERVLNKNRSIGTVLNTENKGVFVNVEWDERKQLGKKWMATSLNIAR